MDVKDCLLSVLYEICFVDIQSVSEYKISMKEDVKKFLGIKVRSMRENAGLTQEELAAICDVSWRTISNLERGLVVPDLLMVFKIAKRFQVSIDEMMGRDFPFRSLSAGWKTKILLWRKSAIWMTGCLGM